MTAVLTCTDADEQARVLAESGDHDGAVVLLAEHAEHADADPGAAHHGIYVKGRLDVFAADLFLLPRNNLFARRAAAAYAAALTA